MKIKAINDCVVVKKLKDQHEVAGGIELHASNNSIRYNFGEVVTASPNTVLKVGDKVYYDSVAGSNLRHEGEKFLVLRERDISIIAEQMTPTGVTQRILAPETNKMNRKDFYDDRRKERKIDFLADYRIVRKYFCRKHDLGPGEFEMLCKLHSLGTFIMKDFKEADGTLTWNNTRWHKLWKEWIIVYRQRKPSEGQNYKIYTLSRKAKRMIEDCYKILCGEKDIPMDCRKNPVMKEETYQDKRYAKAMRLFAEARNNKN